jgi:hypothetical protein
MYNQQVNIGALHRNRERLNKLEYILFKGVGKYKLHALRDFRRMKDWALAESDKKTLEGW